MCIIHDGSVVDIVATAGMVEETPPRSHAHAQKHHAQASRTTRTIELIQISFGDLELLLEQKPRHRDVKVVVGLGVHDRERGKLSLRVDEQEGVIE